MKLKQAVFLMISISAFSTTLQARDRTIEDMWKDDYLAIVKDGVRALKDEDFDTALSKLTESAHTGNKEAQYYLAQMYLYGWGMEPDYQKGWVWLNVALEQKRRKWEQTYREIDNALPEDFKSAMQPKVDEYVSLYGAEAKDLKCFRYKEIGSNIKEIICEKRYY